MADIPLFFVVAFSRAETSGLRAEVAIKVFSKQHAASLASQLAGQGRGAVVFSQAGGPSTAGRADVKILARFGDVPDDRTLYFRLGDLWASRRAGITTASAAPFPRSMPAMPRLRGLWSRPIPFAVQRKRSPKEGSREGARQGPRYSRAIAWLAVAAIATSGSSALVIVARGAQREARLVEMARPACDHAGITNEELHRLVKYGYRSGASKKEALQTVISLCREKPKPAQM
ncbi:hypothetical protein SAMN05444161_3935 [Rhizobiales bacterium GAS191]|nr:hypothetical protein SAMN05444161_3935 [Rhizobiales bacterium GAS191]